MGRVRTNIKIDGRDCWTLFEGGSRNTYIVAEVASTLLQYQLSERRKVALGGGLHNIEKGCLLIARVESLSIETDAYILNEIGRDEEGKRIEVLFGALAMQKWGIRPLPDEERLDMTHYPKEFVEF